MIRPGLVVALPILLAGCSTYYPPLYSTRSVAAQAPPGSESLQLGCKTNPDELEQTIACAEILQAIYSNGYVESAKLQDYSQLPIIGAAAAAAWILLKDKEKAAKKVGKIGIGALTYSEARDQLFPKGMSEIFIKGHSGLGCVITERTYFRGPVAEESFKALNDSLREVARLVALTTEKRYTPAPDKKVPESVLDAARILADQTIETAEKQLLASRQERAAWQFAPSAFRRSVGDIAAWVASKGRDRPNASYKDLLKGMSSSPEGAGGGDSPAPPPPPPPPLTARRYTSEDLLREIAQTSRALSLATIELQGNTPGYAARIEVVRDCATDLSAP